MFKQKNIKWIYFVVLWLTFHHSFALANPKPLTLGLLPYLNLKPLIKKWGPLIKYLERELNRPILITSAKNFKTFINRANNQEYDIYYTAPHFAALAEKQKKYERIVGFNKKLHGDVIVLKTSPFKSILDLENKHIVTPDRLAIITLIGENFLRNHGLIPGKSVFIRYLRSHSSAIHAVALHQADAAIVVGGLIKRMPPVVSNNLRLLATTGNIPHSMLMLNSMLPMKEKNRIREVFNQFGESKKYSVPFYKNVGFGQFQTIPNSDMNFFNKLIPVMLRRMNQH